MDASLPIKVLFAASLPPLLLSIAHPAQAEVRTLKAQIRPHLPPDSRVNALRIIHAGRVLDDRLRLASALPAPPPADASHNGKGKAREHAAQPVIVHCAISSTLLGPAQLAAEAKPLDPSAAPSPGARSRAQDARPSARGFDRLLNTPGFAASDVAALRAQHRAMISSRHTPDDMPTHTQLMDLEEQWLDSSTRPVRAGEVGEGERELLRSETEEEAEATRQIKDILYGAAIGFFWPVGVLCWGFREEGVWSQRRKEMVLLGLGLNLVLGLMRVVSF